MRRLVLILGVTLLASVFATPAGAGGGGHCESQAVSDQRTTVVDMAKACFMPVITRIDKGDTVTWINRDPYSHTVTGAGYVWGDTKDYVSGGRVSHRFTEEGIFPYSCILHPGMVGAVVVGDGVGAKTAAGVVPSEQKPFPPADAEAQPVSENDSSSAGLWLVAFGLVAVLAGGLVTLEMRRRARRQVEVPA